MDLHRAREETDCTGSFLAGLVCGVVLPGGGLCCGRADGRQQLDLSPVAERALWAPVTSKSNGYSDPLLIILHSFRHVQKRSLLLIAKHTLRPEQSPDPRGEDREPVQAQKNSFLEALPSLGVVGSRQVGCLSVL